jgi:hypothetical protein
MTVQIPRTTTPEELLAALKRIDLGVPARTNGRTTQHTETWTICRLLSTLAITSRLAFPVSVIHRDRPDFLLQTPDAEVGIEVTEAISQQYAAYCALAERKFPDGFLEPAHSRWGAPALTTDQMRKLLRQPKLTSDGWAGDRAEKEWALFIQSVVDAKLDKLAHPDFKKFNQTWLSVYDNLPLPHIHLGKAIAQLQPLLQDRWSRVPAFEALYVEHGPVIAEITPRGSEHLVLHDLWE